jgi:hypothetical protein
MPVGGYSKDSLVKQPPDSISIILFITLSGPCGNEIGSEQRYDDRKRRLGPCQTYFISGAQRCDIDMHGYRDNG